MSLSYYTLFRDSYYYVVESIADFFRDRVCPKNKEREEWRRTKNTMNNKIKRLERKNGEWKEHSKELNLEWKNRYDEVQHQMDLLQDRLKLKLIQSKED